MKEIKHEVITQGTPKLENMPKEAFNVFCKSILDIIIEERKEILLKNINQLQNKSGAPILKNKTSNSSDNGI